MLAGVSTACLYPMPLEESLYQLAVNGVSCVEIFVNTDSELRKGFALNIADILRRFDIKCVSVHPFTCELETLMFFSDYPRRIDDILEYYKKYFDFMNTVGAEIFVFHGAKASRCQSGASAFIRDISRMLGSQFAFVLDTKQAVRCGESPFSFIDSAGSALRHIHISDYGQLGDCLPVGKGSFNFGGFLSRARSANPDISVVLELYRSGFSGIGELVSGYSILTGMITAQEEKK